MKISSPLKALFIVGTASFLMAGFATAADQGPEKAAEEFTSGEDLIDLKNPEGKFMRRMAIDVERVGDSHVGVGIYQ